MSALKLVALYTFTIMLITKAPERPGDFCARTCIRQITGYIDRIAKGDKAIILSSGFESSSLIQLFVLYLEQKQVKNPVK